MRQKKLVAWLKKNWWWTYPILTLISPVLGVLCIAGAVIFGIGALLVNILEDEDGSVCG